MMKFTRSFVLSSVMLIPVLYLLSCSESSDEVAETRVAVDKQVTAEVKRLPKLLDLGSVHCIPCKKMAPILDSLKVAYEGRAEIVFIDIRQEKKMARKYGITIIPTQIFFDAGGNEVYRHIGFFPADSITAHFEQLGVTL